MLKLKIVPSWLKEALEGHGKSVDVVLNQEQLLNTLSISDVAFYAHVNSHNSIKLLLGEAYADSFDVSDDMIYAPLTEDEQSTVSKSVLEKLHEEFSLYHYRREMDSDAYLKELLVGLGVYEEDARTLAGHIHFKIIRQTEDALLVEPIVIKDRDLSLKEENELVRDNVFKVIGILCTVYDFKVVARTALFKHYCRLVTLSEEKLK